MEQVTELSKSVISEGVIRLNYVADLEAYQITFSPTDTRNKENSGEVLIHQTSDEALAGGTFFNCCLKMQRS